MAKIALFGGSFNPPHPGHFEMAKHLYEKLEIDEVWFLFSENCQKDKDKYAATKHRLAMGEIMAAHYPAMPFVMSGIQDQIGTHITYKVLSELEQRFPEHDFIWVMGADNLATFHSWEHFEDIIENYPIAVVNRPSYTDKAKNSVTALSYPHLKLTDPKDLAGAKQGWCFLDTPKISLSSSNLLKQLRAGKRSFDPPFQDIVDYIVEHELYGIKTASSDKKNQNKPKP